MVTKAWKFKTPSLSKKEFSTFWDWSNKQDGVRIMEVFCADLTGNSSNIVVRITRDTEEDVYDELDGQITDGYFENYCGKIRYTEIDPDSVKLVHSLVKKALDEQKTVRTIDHDFMSHYSTTKTLYKLAAIMSGLGILPIDLVNAQEEADYWRMCINNPWDTREVSDEEKDNYQKSLEKLTEVRADSISGCEYIINL